MRIALALPLLLLGACQVSKDEANDTVSVTYNEEVAANVGADVANTAENIAGDIGNDVQRTGEKIDNRVDVDVKTEGEATANKQ